MIGSTGLELTYQAGRPYGNFWSETENKKMEQLTISLRITGFLALPGAFLYAIGDVLCLRAILLLDTGKMVVLPPTRLICGALL